MVISLFRTGKAWTGLLINKLNLNQLTFKINHVLYLLEFDQNNTCIYLKINLKYLYSYGVNRICTSSYMPEANNPFLLYFIVKNEV